MKKYDIFLFDADGTLYDFNKAEAAAFKAMFDYCNFDYEENKFKTYREINAQLWRSFEKGEISSLELQITRFSRLFDTLNIQYDAKEFNDKYLTELGKGTYLLNGALDICKDIVSCGKKIYIITNGLLATQIPRLKYSLISEYISDAFISEAVGFQKPGIEFFEHVLLHIPKIGKDKILIVGDSLSADIAGGNAAGIDTCWFNETGVINHSDIVPTYEIRKLDELSEYI